MNRFYDSRLRSVNTWNSQDERESKNWRVSVLGINGAFGGKKLKRGVISQPTLLFFYVKLVQLLYVPKVPNFLKKGQNEAISGMTWFPEPYAF